MATNHDSDDRPGRQDDPDAQGLPPGAVLPDPYEFRRNQYQGRLVVSAVALVVIVVLLVLSDENRVIVAVCAAAVAMAVVLNFVGLMAARRAIRENPRSSHPKQNHD